MIRFESLKASLEVLKKLNNVNDFNGQIIPYDNFYIPEVTEIVDIRKDYVNWVHRGKTLPSVSVSVDWNTGSSSLSQNNWLKNLELIG